VRRGRRSGIVVVNEALVDGDAVVLVKGCNGCRDKPSDKMNLSWALLADVIRVIGCSDADLQR